MEAGLHKQIPFNGDHRDARISPFARHSYSHPSEVCLVSSVLAGAFALGAAGLEAVFAGAAFFALFLLALGGIVQICVHKENKL